MNTTIQLSQEMKEKIASFGMKNESYDTILRRIYNLAVQHQLIDFLKANANFIPIDEAIKGAEKKWPKSK